MKPILKAFAPIILSASAFGQVLPLPPPSDTDLLAAYCLRVYQHRIELANEIWATLTDQQQAEDSHKRAVLYAEHERIRRYLLGRSMTFDPAPTLMAARQGDDDWKDLLASARQGDANRATTLAERTGRCEGAKFLPY
jgi:hypothetical protein